MFQIVDSEKYNFNGRGRHLLFPGGGGGVQAMTPGLWRTAVLFVEWAGQISDKSSSRLYQGRGRARGFATRCLGARSFAGTLDQHRLDFAMEQLPGTPYQPSADYRHLGDGTIKAAHDVRAARADSVTQGVTITVF